MRMKTNNDKPTARWSRQQSSNGQSAENGNHAEENQHGPTPIPPNIGLTNDTGNKCNKRIRWSEEEMKEVVWCFIYLETIPGMRSIDSLQKAAVLDYKESATI
jgi:hypothetical protein